MSDYDDGNPIWDYAAEYDDEPDIEDYDYRYDWQQEAAWDAYWRSPRGRLKHALNAAAGRIGAAIRWLKWHNRKCQRCGKPALSNGTLCWDCDIPF